MVSRGQRTSQRGPGGPLQTMRLLGTSKHTWSTPNSQFEHQMAEYWYMETLFSCLNKAQQINLSGRYPLENHWLIRQIKKQANTMLNAGTETFLSSTYSLHTLRLPKPVNKQQTANTPYLNLYWSA